MKFSYFNEKDKGYSLASLGRGVTGAISTISPKFAALIGRNVLMRPYGRRAYNNELIKPEQELSLLTSIGCAHVNIYGSGEQVIIVSHGWADNSQSFDKMIVSLVNQGYLVAAIDHIGHGKSTGNKSHLLSFIETTEALIKHFDNEGITVKSIIAHSMGAVATLNLPQNLLLNKKIILISSPIKFFELMFEKVEQVGISKKLLTAVLENIGRKYNKNWKELATEQHLDKLSMDFTFIHDQEDRFAPYADLENFLKGGNNHLVATSGLGHKRILGDTNVINNINQVLSA